MPKNSTSSLRDSFRNISNKDDVLDLNDEMAGALDSSVDAEASALLAPPARRASRSAKTASGNASKKSSSVEKTQASPTKATARKRSGDAFSRRAARENADWEGEPEGHATPDSHTALDIFPTAPWRKPHRAGAKSHDKPGDKSHSQSPESETIYRVNKTSAQRGHQHGPQGDGKRRSHSGGRPRTASTLIFEIGGVLLLAVGAVLLFNALQPQAEGLLPRFGISVLRFLFGLGAVIFPLLIGALGVLLIVQRQRTNFPAFFGGVGMAFPVFLTALHLQVPPGEELLQSHSHDFGGVIGASVALALRTLLGETGAIIALGALAIVALLVLTNLSLADTMGRAGRGVGRGARRVGSKTRRVWRHGVELAYEPSKSSDPFARQLGQYGEQEFVQHDSYPEQQTTYAEQASALAPALAAPLPPRRISNGVSAPRLASRRATPQHQEPPFGPVAEDNFAAPEFAPVQHPAHPVDNSQQPASDSSSMKRASPFFALNDLMNHAVPTPKSPAPLEKVQPTIEPPVSNDSVPKSKELRAVPGKDAAPRIEIVDAPPPPSVVAEASGEPSSAEPVPINRLDDELTPQEALEAQAQASAQAEEPIIEITRKPKRAGRPRRRFGDGPLMPDYFDEAVRALDPPVRMDHSGAEEDIQHGVQNVTETLASFKIDARVTDVKRGPVITRYEVQPAPGVRVAAIANLDRDLARSLSAIAVRIEAPVPGKNVVGIEVPNKKVHLVRLRDVLELPEFLSGPSKLSFVLGKDIAGQPKWADLTKMPHMLIAGATNSGKSVCLNAIITSIISRAAPDEVKFSLIDPKRVELTLYRDIPHLYHPVVVEPKEAVRALRGMITEMDRRYKRFAERGVRNIVSYNSKLQEGEDPLPYIVIVIDELADLMMTAAAEFEKLICRLAQLARATGIHLIVATQRPSVNVITGVIKANIPARIAFAVASQVDSRTILDSVGAERLIGSGDMLFDANNGGKAVRIQGAFLSEEECNRIVQVVKAAYGNEELEYGLDLSAIEDEESSGTPDKIPSDEKRDELYDQIKEFVLRHDEMSASNIQRKFEIGYPRAGRIVDQLERDGILGPADGPKARKVLGSGQ